MTRIAKITVSFDYDAYDIDDVDFFRDRLLAEIDDFDWVEIVNNSEVKMLNV